MTASEILKKQCRFSMNFKAENNEEVKVLTLGESQFIVDAYLLIWRELLVTSYANTEEVFFCVCVLTIPTLGNTVPGSPRPFFLLFKTPMATFFQPDE